MKALRVHVERIVRPIRASVPRKNKMREELLGHLSIAYEEERAFASTEAEALDNAKRRFGDPGALRDELQKSVPWYERIGHARLPLRLVMDTYSSSARTGWRLSARVATEILLVLVVGAPILCIIVMCVTSLSGLPRPDMNHLPSILMTIAEMFSILWFSLFVTFWVFDLTGARKRVAPSSTTPAPVKAFLSTLLWSSAIGLFLVLSTTYADLIPARGAPNGTARILRAAQAEIPQGPWLALALFAGLIITMSIAMSLERRQYEAWGCLDIDGD